MSRVFRPDGTVVPVTTLKAGPCVVTQVKTAALDGYQAVQIGFGSKRKLTRQLQGHFKPSGQSPRHVREFLVGDGDWKVGQQLDASQFTPGDTVQVVGISKGKGFQGVVRRHGFHGHPSTHGHKDQERMPGSIGAGGVQHVRKGLRMAGRMGGVRTTVKHLEVVSAQANELVVKGAVPGARHALLLVTKE